MRWWCAVALLACQQRSDPTGSGSSTTPDAPATVIVGCAPAGARPRVANPGPQDSTNDRPTSIATGWFPYARGVESPPALADPVGVRLRVALGEHLAELDACAPGKTGSISAMFEVAPSGTLAVRVGGLGDKGAEACLAGVLGKLTVEGAKQPVEIECGLAVRGGGPLRVAVEAGPRVVEVSKAGVRIGDATELPKDVPQDTIIVLADPDVPSADLSRVLAWSHRAPAVLLAVRADGGAPVFVALAPDARVGAVRASRLGLVVEDKTLHACVAAHRGSASLLEAKKVDATVLAALAACEKCDEVIEIGIGDNHLAKDLVGAASAVRRAGRDPVLALAPRCRSDLPPTK